MLLTYLLISCLGTIPRSSTAMSIPSKIKKYPGALLRLGFFILFSILVSTAVSAATLKGTIYNEELVIENNVLVEINTVPIQKYLAAEGSYSFELPQGKYTLTARKGFEIVSEEIEIIAEGEYVFDLFLLPDFVDEDELWQDTEEQLFTEDELATKNRTWAYIVAGLIFLLALWRIYRARKKYGSLWKFRKHHQMEAKKTIEQHQEELAQEPGYLDEVIEVIKKHDGRISQLELRREMLHLSEAKISLIVTELEHKGKIEKVKKGRGNVIILK